MWKILRPDAEAVTKNQLAKKSLARYFSVADNCKPAKFLKAQRTPARFDKNYTLEALWAEHARCTDEYYRIEHETDQASNFDKLSVPEKSYFELKLEIADRILQNCHFCLRKCGINRKSGKVGYCGCGERISVSSLFEHTGEEPELVPSGTIFTMGCTIRCLHCQNWTIAQWAEESTGYAPQVLAAEIEQLRLNACRNVNLVGGDPTPWLAQWLQVFKYVKVNVPVVWNSNSYYSPETARLLEGFADVYLLDFKYGPGECAKKISDASNYWETSTANLLEAKKYGELIIRVLVLPDHLNCCTKPVLQWIVDNLGEETRVNLMFQYRPEWRAHEAPELRRRLNRYEAEQAIQLAKKAGLKNFIT